LSKKWVQLPGQNAFDYRATPEYKGLLSHRHRVDITPQRELEARLQQAQRLEAIGRLTAGVAHDFNNLLQGMMCNLELLGDTIQDRPMAHGFVTSIQRIVKHGGELTADLLSFSRQQVLRPEIINLSKFLEEFRAVLTPMLDPRIRVTIVADSLQPPIWADTTHLHTALLNLSINARDAMPSGGDLRIEVIDSSSHGAEYGLACMMVIRVIDTGAGMDREALAKACEPFFSTKGLNGTGLGLSMVYGFAKQSGGDLRISSEPNRGTSVELWLPLADEIVERQLKPTL
jgi:signal transduction histidine kinase